MALCSAGGLPWLFCPIFCLWAKKRQSAVSQQQLNDERPHSDGAVVHVGGEHNKAGPSVSINDCELP